MNADRRLALWLRQLLVFDDPGASSPADQDEPALLAEVRRRAALRRRRRTRARMAAASLGATALLAGGGALAAAVWGGDQPRRPESGPVCRSDASVGAPGQVLPVGSEPVAACRALWEAGDMAAGVDAVPPLTACIGSGGLVEVFPGRPEVCESLGLTLADPTLDDAGQAVADLTGRLADEVNLAPCLPVPQVVAVVQKILDESSLPGWTVAVDEASAAGVCGKAAVESSTRTVIVHEF